VLAITPRAGRRGDHSSALPARHIVGADALARHTCNPANPLVAN